MCGPAASPKRFMVWPPQRQSRSNGCNAIVVERAGKPLVVDTTRRHPGRRRRAGESWERVVGVAAPPGGYPAYRFGLRRQLAVTGQLVLEGRQPLIPLLFA